MLFYSKHVSVLHWSTVGETTDTETRVGSTLLWWASAALSRWDVEPGGVAEKQQTRRESKNNTLSMTPSTAEFRRVCRRVERPQESSLFATLAGHIWKTTRALNIIEQHYLQRISKEHFESISRTESGHTDSSPVPWSSMCPPQKLVMMKAKEHLKISSILQHTCFTFPMVILFIRDVCSLPRRPSLIRQLCSYGDVE